MLPPLPVDRAIPDILSGLQRHRAVVIVADPGAGKTTRVPPALVAAGPAMLLQPRRAAARAVAHRIAVEQGWTPGVEVGWQVRLETRAGARTRLLVVTEGILTARLRSDPLLGGFRTVILDEFHERSIHGDLAIALAREAWRARDDLQLVVMSATIDADRVSGYLADCPVVTVPGRLHPVERLYRPDLDASAGALQALHEAAGDVLVFQPGAREIGLTLQQLRGRVGPDVDLLPLHGSLTLEEQQRALSPSSGRRRIIVSTNVAETSVTVPGVTAVVDSGFEKVARYDAARGIDTLELARISEAASEQRAGRAGRVAPGRAYRLWSAADRLAPYRIPDIHRVDLAAAVLDVVAWGGDPRRFAWYERPTEDRLDAALALLHRLGALEGLALTSTGKAMSALPLQPRLARILLAGKGHPALARSCAVLSAAFGPASDPEGTADLLAILDRWTTVPPAVQQLARELERLVAASERPVVGEAVVQRALLAGYSDRVAQRRAPGANSFLLATGTGAVLNRGATLDSATYVLAFEVRRADGARAGDSVINLASAIDRSWLEPTGLTMEHRLTDDGRVRGIQREQYGAITLSERIVAPDPQESARVLAAAYMARGGAAGDAQLLRRAAFAGVSLDYDELVRRAAAVVDSIDAIDVRAQLPSQVVRDLERLAPDSLVVPSGRRVPLQYGEDGGVLAEVKLQELFGLAETPRVGRHQVPLTLVLLAPNGRPVQTTTDLRSFWNRTYVEVRKELRGRYPRHPWPEDPWTAPPTARAKPRGRS